MRQPENFYIQSGVIPYRVKNNELQILLITSRKKQNWIIPKGIVEEGLTPRESAAVEAFEEAGIKGEIDKKLIGSYIVKKWEGDCLVNVFPMKVLKEYDDWEESYFRKRKWFSNLEACEKIKNKKLKKLIELFLNQFNNDRKK